jgi:hypothetical protein
MDSQSTAPAFPITDTCDGPLGVNEDRFRILLKSTVLSWLRAADACYDLSPTNWEGEFHATLRTALCVHSYSSLLGDSPCWVCIGEGCNGFEKVE